MMEQREDLVFSIAISHVPNKTITNHYLRIRETQSFVLIMLGHMLGFSYPNYHGIGLVFY